MLTLALLPLVALMPLLFLLGMARWTTDYDKVLLANVESDLRIAEQYLSRLLIGTGTEVEAVAESVDLKEAFTQGPEAVAQHLAAQQEALELDFLYYLPRDQVGSEAERWPIIAAAGKGELATEIDIFEAADLERLPGDLDARAAIPLIETEAAVPTTRTVEDRGMVVHTASPVQIDEIEGVLVGGILLNRNLDFIDTINALVYLNAITGGQRQGTATLFLDDVRVSTNVRLFEDVRALGTRVSAEVRNGVLNEGQTWLNRAFVVNDWYISGYLPLTDSFGKRVGMLYVGFLEEPFNAAKRAAYLTMMGAFAIVLIIFIPFFLRLAKGIFSPLERMTKTMSRVEKGDLAARIGSVGSEDEIGKVAEHLDTLLDEVQERDRALRSWADELNARVEDRTAELKEANTKLEETYQQLVMSEKLASIGEITAGVAHEINNPVAVIQGNVDVMRQTLGEKAAPVQTELGLIDRQVQRIDAIVSKLLQFARPTEFGAYEEAVEIAPLLEDCLVLVDHVFSKKEIKVVKEIGDAPPVRISPGELQQIVINLIVNAVQAMEGHGILTLSLETTVRDGRSGACLQVRDTGPGIPKGKLKSVFDPFFTTKLGEGTGLGLSISQNLIQRANGLISVRNVASGGAEFSVWLPEDVGEMAAE